MLALTRQSSRSSWNTKNVRTITKTIRYHFHLSWSSDPLYAYITYILYLYNAAGGTNIDNWSFSDLKDCVAEFTGNLKTSRLPRQSEHSNQQNQEFPDSEA